jgi:hypothetical protein
MLTWTKEKPTKPGWYWLRLYVSRGDLGSGYRPNIAYVQDDGSICFLGSESDLKIEEVLEGEWAGPIEPPEE